MSKLSSEEERQLIADVEAARDDPDSPLTPVSLQVAENASAVLSVRLPFETLVRLETAAEAGGVSLSDLIDCALDALASSSDVAANDVLPVRQPASHSGDPESSARAS